MRAKHWTAFLLVAVMAVAAPVVSSQCETEDDVIYLEASVDDPTPYVGQQIIYTVRIVNTTQYSPVSEMPDFEGFWSAGALDIQQYDEPGCGGRTLGVTINERILFPLRTGEITISQGTLDFSRNPVYEAATRIVSNEVVVNVQPLPEGAPSTFEGAVGGPFFLSASLGRTSVDEGDPVSLEVLVDGAGNVDQLEAPALVLPESWRVYPQPTDIQVASGNRALIGQKLWRWLLVPGQTGTIDLPPVEFSYFDLELERYQTLRAELPTLDVQPADREGEPLDVSSLLPPDDDQLTPLKTAAYQSRTAVIPTALLAGGAWSMGAVGLLGSVWWRWHRERQMRRAESIRRKQALKAARSRLAEATRRKGDAAYRSIISALLAYFGDKWNRQPFGLELGVICEELEAAGISSELIAQLVLCFERAEEGRYAPADTAPPRQLVRDTLAVLMELETVLEGDDGAVLKV